MSGFLLSTRSWVIESVVVATGAWFFGRELNLTIDPAFRLRIGSRCLEVGQPAQELRAAGDA